MWWRWQHQCVYATGAGSLWFQESELCGMSELWRRGKGLFWNEVGHAQPKYRLMSHDSLPSAYSASLVSNFREDLSAAWAVRLTQQPIRALQKIKGGGDGRGSIGGSFLPQYFFLLFFVLKCMAGRLIAFTSSASSFIVGCMFSWLPLSSWSRTGLESMSSMCRRSFCKGLHSVLGVLVFGIVVFSTKLFKGKYLLSTFFFLLVQEMISQAKCFILS